MARTGRQVRFWPLFCCDCAASPGITYHYCIWQAVRACSRTHTRTHYIHLVILWFNSVVFLRYPGRWYYLCGAWVVFCCNGRLDCFETPVRSLRRGGLVYCCCVRFGTTRLPLRKASVFLFVPPAAKRMVAAPSTSCACTFFCILPSMHGCGAFLQQAPLSTLNIFENIAFRQNCCLYSLRTFVA